MCPLLPGRQTDAQLLIDLRVRTLDRQHGQAVYRVYKVYRMVSGVSWLVTGACAGALKDAGGKDKVFRNARCAGLFCKYI